MSKQNAVMTDSDSRSSFAKEEFFMCGIYARISRISSRNAKDNELRDIHAAIAWRGPDHQQRVEIECGAYRVEFYASVLHLRGSQGVFHQPVVSVANGDIFMWNGEVFGDSRADQQIRDDNDTKILSERLFQNEEDDGCTFHEHLKRTLGAIEGPFAFLYWRAADSCLYFARDYLGRRSLLLNRNGAANDDDANDEEMTIASVAYPELGKHQRHLWSELPARRMFCIDLKRANDGNSMMMQDLGELEFQCFGQEQHLRIPTDIPSNNQLIAYDTDGLPIMTDEMTQLLHKTNHILSEAVRIRIQTIPARSSSSEATGARVAILFSGGLDCTVLAALVHQYLPADEPIDLLNVAFENPRAARAKQKPSSSSKPASSFKTAGVYDVPDRLTGRQSARELKERYPERDWRLVEVNVPFEEYQQHRAHIVRLMFPSNTVMDLSIAAALWFAGRGRGYIYPPADYVNVDTQESTTMPPVLYESTAKVLLSGLGADELLAGYSRHRQAFQSPHTNDNSDYVKENNKNQSMNTDSKNGPLNDSINNESNKSTNDPYLSLIASLQMDLDRLPTRNLGRDDRVLSSLGKEVRWPYLDERVVQHLSHDLPIAWRCDLRPHRRPHSINSDNLNNHNDKINHDREAMMDGSKIWLRLLAAELLLGRHSPAARLTKRAMQFGARTAKLQTSGERGDDVLIEYQPE